jgi:hypothetical protein
VNVTQEDVEGLEHVAKFREPIERALKEGYGQMNYNDVIDYIKSGEFQFWSSENSCVITTVDIFPRIKQLTVVIGAGDLNEIDTIIRPVIEEWARQIACDTMLIMGRPGWQRALEGYRRTAVVLEKRL